MSDFLIRVCRNREIICKSFAQNEELYFSFGLEARTECVAEKGEERNKCRALVTKSPPLDFVRKVNVGLAHLRSIQQPKERSPLSPTCEALDF